MSELTVDRALVPEDAKLMLPKTTAPVVSSEGVR